MPTKPNSQIVQIIPYANDTFLICLCKDGSIWELNLVAQTWRRIYE